MSGGVGPYSDIRLPKESDRHDSEKDQNAFTNNQKPPANRGFLAFRQMNALSVIIVLSASGMVSVEDLSFVVFSLIYMQFILRIAFPFLGHPTENPVLGENAKLVNLHAFFGVMIGVFFPIAYILEGILEGDKQGIKAAAPHVFLLASQLFMEGVASLDRFSIPIRVFVPVLYNTRRIFTIADWLRSEISKVDEGYGGSARRLYIGRGLAAANIIYWCFNLFGFLLPLHLPKALKTYYSQPKVKD